MHGPKPNKTIRRHNGPKLSPGQTGYGPEAARRTKGFQMTLLQDSGIASAPPHAHDFLYTIPIDGLGQMMNHRQFRSVLCHRISVPMFSEGSLCPSCNVHRMDKGGDHAVGIMVRKEASMGFLSEDGKDLRPTDLLLFNWLQGKDVCLDVTCISPFASMGALSWAPGVALHNAAKKKKRKYASICEENGYKFIPFVFSTYGEFDTDALNTLSRIKSISISHSNNAKSGVFLFHRVQEVVLLADFQCKRCQERVADIVSRLKAYVDQESWSYVSALPRTLSDHCPVLLTVGSKQSGPKAFKIFDHWFTVPGFDSLVNKSWSEGLYNGTPDIILKNKLKKLKGDIKEWNYSKRVESNRLKEELKKRIFDWDQKAELGSLSPNDVDAMEELLLELMHLEQNDRNSLNQKSRVKWAIEGDENTKFFHTLVNKKARKQAINGLIWNGSWTEDMDTIKNAAFSHYQDRFKESTHQRPKFRSSLFRKLEASDATFLEASISIDEIKDAVWSCSGSKSQCPDGINFNFLRRYWELLKHDFFNAIKHFKSSAILARGCNPSFIVLVPKINDPLQMSDYRRVSLIGYLYKIISKILSTRLAKVIHKLISANQTAFLAGRKILDGCLIANEIINCAKSGDSRLLLFKEDFEKAFDSVNWSVLHDIMQQMGFGVKWRKWVNACMISASISVLVNGSPSREFKMERGLRHGDPLSLFLFLIAEEALQVLTLDACNKCVYKGLSLAEDDANVSLLQYAYGCLVLWRMVNLSKRCLYGVGVPLNEDAIVAEAVKFLNKLSSWKSKLMSIGGHLTLIKAVLGSMPLYHLSLFRAPIKFIKRLEAIRSRFLRAKNLSLLGKWMSRFHTEDTTLWRKVIKEIHGPDGGFVHMAHRGTRIGLWSEIVKNIEYIKNLEIPLDNLIVRKITSGEKTRFWKDKWCSSGHTIMDLYPRLFVLENNKDRRVCDRWRLNNGVWNADILLNRIAFPARSQGADRALYGACYVLLWSIWRWRNKLLHASSKMWMS
uniref:Reverse transcriptase domain-containing protein n=1 Tax=Tanacetum cinerariifolium TaxID=118510 RepID=A0A6L2LDK8_TANCI|nr:hypothetical protein [Tanacetum cinerariifolium]